MITILLNQPGEQGYTLEDATFIEYPDKDKPFYKILGDDNDPLAVIPQTADVIIILGNFTQRRM